MHGQERTGFYFAAFDSDNDIVEEWEIDDADVHFSGVQVDTAIVLVLLIVKSHGVASFGWGLWE